VSDGEWGLGTGENPGITGAVAAISDRRISRARRVRRGRQSETAATDFMYEIPRQIETEMKVQSRALTLRKQDSKKVLWIS
jgi:hypothetical protein